MDTGAPEICVDGIDQDCDGTDLVCAPIDSDGDSIMNYADNCINTPNSDQYNTTFMLQYGVLTLARELDSLGLTHFFARI
jgi:hypothetical protein